MGKMAMAALVWWACQAAQAAPLRLPAAKGAVAQGGSVTAAAQGALIRYRGWLLAVDGAVPEERPDIVLTSAEAHHAPLLQMELPRIRDRVNAVYGFNAIARVTITQTAAQGFAEGQAQFQHRPATPGPPHATPQATAAAEAIAARFDDPRLADSMRRLALARAARAAAR